MGIATILAAATKQISWEQIANIAMKYGPDIIRKLKEQLLARPDGESGAGVTAEQLGGRIQELESALIKQEEIIEQQNKNIELLEEIGKTLQARLNIFMAISVLSLVASVVLGILLLRK